MKKLLFQFDTDPQHSAFDTVVAFDGGADNVIGYANCDPENVVSLVEGTIFTRSAKNKKFTSIFISGSDISAGDALLDAVKNIFFENFRVSIMLDCNGCNTTAAAAVASIMKSGDIKGKKAVILAGTGPVGGRAAVMMEKQGAQVAISSRRLERSKLACNYLNVRFSANIEPHEAKSNEERALLIEDANIVLATGAAGIQLLDAKNWKINQNIEVLVDTNAVPPTGIEGIMMTDRGEDHEGKKTWGSIGIGPSKLALQRQCIARLFEQNDLVLDVDEIFNMAKEMI